MEVGFQLALMSNHGCSLAAAFKLNQKHLL